MKWVWGAVAFALVVVVSPMVYVTGAEAAYKPRGKCLREYRAWRRKPGGAAFAVNRRGDTCGWSSGYGSRKTASRYAVSQCRSLRRGRCRVYSSKPGGKRAARYSGKPTGDCKRSYNKWRNQTGYRVFMMAKDGSSCAYSWGGSSLEQAKEKASTQCGAKEKCRIYEVRVPKELLIIRQESLTELGYYEGKLDGIWGRGSKRSLRRFLKAAGFGDAGDEQAYELLKWASRIKREYQVDAAFAVQRAGRAYEQKSVAFVASELASKLEKKPSHSGKFHPRSNALARSLGKGLAAAGPWLLGKHTWQFKETLINSSRHEKIGRCRLATDGLMFVQYTDPALGMVAFFDKPFLPFDVLKGTWIFDTARTFPSGVVNKPDLGSFLAISDPVEFFSEIRNSRALTIQMPGLKNTRTFDVAKARPILNRFLACAAVARSQATASPKLANAGTAGRPKPTGVAEAKRNAAGQYYFLTQIDGEPVLALVDTGAFRVTINESMAKRIGLRVDDKAFNKTTSTANGIASYADAKVKEIRIGGVVVKDIDVAVMRDKSLVGTALLGMSFLNKLTRFEFSGSGLKLVQ